MGRREDRKGRERTGTIIKELCFEDLILGRLTRSTSN
jgi:hypothetical protein